MSRRILADRLMWSRSGTGVRPAGLLVNREQRRSEFSLDLFELGFERESLQFELLMTLGTNRRLLVQASRTSGLGKFTLSSTDLLVRLRLIQVVHWEQLPRLA